MKGEQNGMGINKFMEYIEENFNISGEAGRLIVNILRYVQSLGVDEGQQHLLLCDLLDNTIWLSEREIAMVALDADDDYCPPEETIHEKLREKIEAEYKEFEKWLETLPAREIVEKSYEKVFKEELMMLVAYTEHSEEFEEKLLGMENSLDYLYEEWMHTDAGVNQILEDMIGELEVEDDED